MYPDVYVGGFLAVYTADSSDLYAVDREIMGRALPPDNIIPLNIDHRSKCVVGRVLTIHDCQYGPFCLCKITSKNLFEIMMNTADPSLFDNLQDRSEVEKLLYLISNYIASFSMSSKRINSLDEVDKNYIAHVSLCILGKRLGTVVVYHQELSSVVLPFDALSGTERDAIVAEAKAAEVNQSSWDNEFIEPVPEILYTSLFSQALNTNFIPNRWAELKKQKAVATMIGETYLQASSKASIPAGLQIKGPVENFQDKLGMENNERVSSGVKPPDCVYVPMEYFNKLVGNHHYPPTYHPPQPPPVPQYAQYYGAPSHISPTPNPKFSELESKLDNLLKQFNKPSEVAAPQQPYYEKVITSRGVAFKRVGESSGLKRKLPPICYDDGSDEDDLVFPGEARHVTKPKKSAEKEPAVDNTAIASSLGLIMQTLSGFQSEIQQLKSKTQEAPPEGPNTSKVTSEPVETVDASYVAGIKTHTSNKNEFVKQMMAK
ncbi:capsid maturation protease [Testudinid alphaherpesvirus 3]|uniref:Capsid protein P40 n=2 Tax=Testudinid alphaherpesvirus 3 TaxID=2560801 RepID=A0A0M3WPG2_9ALPH|nr:capsid maturation protease [Testudinid alphaherpesvirus 3]AKI81655.1 capsid maturation protease [Testudinid alphaherpesvirus 3]AKI81758.1 capsid maturation protease [Testudinid alphaherpesvirus 3]